MSPARHIAVCVAFKPSQSKFQAHTGMYSPVTPVCRAGGMIGQSKKMDKESAEKGQKKRRLHASSFQGILIKI